MKRTHLSLASALLSVLLLSGVSSALAADKAPAKETKKTEMPAEKTPGKGMMSSGLSEESQKMMHDSMMQCREENKATHEEIRAKREEMKALLKAPTFDKAAYLAKAEEVQTLQHKAAKARAEAMASVAEKLSAEERAKLADHKGGRRGMMKEMHDGKGPHGMMMKGDHKGPGPMMDADPDNEKAPE